MFKHRVNETSGDRVNRASSVCIACPDGSPLSHTLNNKITTQKILIFGLLHCSINLCEFYLV